jgi:hypothetical protein
MTGSTTYLDTIKMTLKNRSTGDLLPVYIDVFNDPLSTKWYNALNDVLRDDLHLEKNYQFFGIPEYERDGPAITAAINRSIAAINNADLGYQIDNHYTMENCIEDINGEIGNGLPGRKLVHHQFNLLHRYFEELQGTAGPTGGGMSPFYEKASPEIRWHIRQLNLLCHEFESWALSFRKKEYAPEWMRPSQIMCYIQAPRFELTEEDYDSFGVDTLARPLGGVFVGVNKAVGKHHWEVYNDEGKAGAMIDDLTTLAMRPQCQAAGDFDIEWGNDPSEYEFMKKDLAGFRAWLIANGLDPEDKNLTIGHPQCGQVDLVRSFGTTDYREIWAKLFDHLDVASIKTKDQLAEYPYHWSDPDYMQQQVDALEK